jgi:cyclopropane-fatty-acyl-phospholipid synthase
MISLDQLLARDIVPDALIRVGIRHLLGAKLEEEKEKNAILQLEKKMQFVRELRSSPVAIKTKDANEQHYEVPTEFFRYVLGPRMKYSSCHYSRPEQTLAEAEEEMLALTCQRAEIRDGLEILELGCGWGSLTLWLAENYPNAKITAVSNSSTQREYITEALQKLGNKNVNVVTCDMNDFEPGRTFDRVVSVEMFEHMKNYRELLQRVARWLKTDGLLFVHIFTHVEYAYHFEGKDPSDWITRYFFEGGTMPSDDLLLYFQDDLKIQNHWRVCGTHYQKTAEHWLENMDRNREAITPILQSVYGEENLARWRAYWRVFFMSCAELWGFRGGNEWLVSHYLFRK